MEQKIYSLKELAELLKVSQSLIRRLAHGNKIKYFKVGRELRFTEQNVNEYIDNAINQNKQEQEE